MIDERFAMLYRRHGPAIYARCHALLGDDAEAEDAMQETFMRVHRNLERVPEQREALYWIYRVATNYCLNEIRNRKRRPKPIGELPETLFDGDGAEARVVNHAVATQLIRRVRPHLRAVAWLYHIDGFDQEQTAAILDLSRRTVASRLAEFISAIYKLVGRANVP